MENFWRSYIQQNPAAHIVCATMSVSVPTHIEDNRWLMTVGSTAQRDIMTEAMPKVLDYMRSHLLNDNFNIEIHVEEGEPSPEIWNRSELLSHMAEDSENFRNFVKEFKLTLD